MNQLTELLAGPSPALLGVVHLAPLPGAPRHGCSMAAVLERAREDASALGEGGVHALVVENFGDVPFHRSDVPAETVAAMTLCAAAVREVAPDLPLGINVLRNDVRSALGIAAVLDADFVRVNVHTGVAVGDQGMLEGRAAETLRERQRLAPRVAILADVHVKHATNLGDESIAVAAEEAVQRALADAVIVSGAGTGKAALLEDVSAVAGAVGRDRVLIGSGVTEANAAQLLSHAGGAIVGTALEEGGIPGAPVELRRVQAMARLFGSLT